MTDTAGFPLDCVEPSAPLPTTVSTRSVLPRLFKLDRFAVENPARKAEERAPIAESPSRPLIGNRYVLLEELGRGGMGIVHLAWDIVLRQVVAIKTLLPGEHVTPERIEGLRQEAALQIGLVHHGIVRLLNFEPGDSRIGPYIIMEYVPWTSGTRWMAEAGPSRLPLRAVLNVGISVCEALSYAHSVNVLHCDIKPSNVFVDAAGKAAKLADFGIARLMAGAERTALVTKLIGTPGYMAPEQKSLGAMVSPRTDLFLLSRTLADFMGAHLSADGSLEFPDDRSAASAVGVLKRGLAPKPENRPGNAREFGHLLEAALIATV